MQNAGDKSAIFRVFEATGCHTQMELAELLGIRQSSISDAKRRNSVPADWLVKLLKLKGINPDWIETGLGPSHLGPATGESAPHVMHLTETRPPRKCSTQDLVTELVRRSLAQMK